MLNGPSRTPVQREIAEAISGPAITMGIEGRLENTGGAIGHEVSAVLAKVAGDKQIRLYLGHEPDGNYLTRVHQLPGFHTPGIGQLMTGPEALRYTPRDGISIAPADLRMLADSYQHGRNPNMFDYKPPGGCSSGYRGQG